MSDKPESSTQDPSEDANGRSGRSQRIEIGPTIPSATVEAPRSWIARIGRRVVGAPRDLHDPHLFHQISLIALLAWIGLGADGLSSSSYGPDQAWLVLTRDKATYLGVLMVVATALTVFIISYAYSRIIEHFPHGGGGYVVASKLLGQYFGVTSGCALLVDYILTVTTSIASGGDSVFSLLPVSWNHWKLPAEIIVSLTLIVLNLRGVRESITALAPIFLVFVLTHFVLIVGGIVSHVGDVPDRLSEMSAGVHNGLSTIGTAGLLLMFLRAYSMGGGTYTGIEAVSNGLQIMREPKVRTGKRTMVLMAVSLAFTAGGIMLCYLLVERGGLKPALDAAGNELRTMNEVLAEKVAGGIHLGGLHVGQWFVTLTLASEAALLFVAAQTGFIDGPRVMSNMALDSWLPHRFASLSDRLTMRNGVWVMGIASLIVLLYTRGDITMLVTMYSINVFITFSLSNLGMCRFWVRERREHAEWKRHLAIHVIGLILCLSILTGTIVIKFAEGGWLTLAITAVVIGMCLVVKRHYSGVYESVGRLDQALDDLPAEPGAQVRELNPKDPTAALLVSRYGGLGKHTLLNIGSYFRGHFKNVVFLSVGVIDTGSFKGSSEVAELTRHTEESLDRYVKLAQGLGFAAKHEMAVGTDTVAEAEKLCRQVAREFPGVIFFSGKLIFERPSFYQRVLHNETANQIQRRLQFAGLPMVILPVRVLTERTT
jgi:amino acid transporter